MRSIKNKGKKIDKLLKEYFHNESINLFIHDCEKITDFSANVNGMLFTNEEETYKYMRLLIKSNPNACINIIDFSDLSGKTEDDFEEFE